MVRQRCCPTAMCLMMTSPGIFDTGAVFFEWDGTNLNQVRAPPNGPSDSSYYGHMLVLPTGQILFTDFSNDVELYTSTGSPYLGLRPPRCWPRSPSLAGRRITLFGNKFNGASQANAYGDDFQDATNYPLVRITNKSHGASYLLPHPRPQYDGSWVSGTHLHPCGHTRQHAYRRKHLEVVANGIASQKYPIVIE